MADISLCIAHKMGKAQAKKLIQKEILASALGDFFQIEADWKGNACSISGPAQGSIEITDDEIKVELDLGFKAKLFRSKIESKLKERVEKVLG